MRSIQRRKEREEKGKRKGNNYIAIALIALVSLGGLYLYNNSMRERINEDTDLCPEAGPRGYWTVVLDTSDSLTETQKLWVRRYFDEVVAGSLPKYYQVSLYSTTSSGNDATTPQLRMCNPGDGSDKGIYISNAKLARRSFEKQFLAPINKWLDEELDGDVADESPLMKYISNISTSAFPVSNRDIDLHLVIVSDMLEHTSEYSHYRSTPEFGTAKNQPFHARLAPHLEGVTVHLIYVKRTGQEHIQKKPHVDFWREFFFFHGGRVILVDPI